MLDHFITAHRFLAYAIGAGLFTVLGYLESRAFSKEPLMAIGTWIFALLWFAFDLATTRDLFPLGPALAIAVLVGGSIWMARYYEKHRPQ
jgi:hypothetical protein